MSFLKYVHRENLEKMNSLASKQWHSDYANIIFLRSLKEIEIKSQFPTKPLLFICNFLFFFFCLLLTPFFAFLFFVFFNIRAEKGGGFKGQIKPEGDIYLCRTKATFDKYSNLLKKEDLIFFENHKYNSKCKQISIFHVSNLADLKAMLYCLITVFRDLWLLHKDFVVAIGSSIKSIRCMVRLYLRVIPRLIHKVCYEGCYRSLLDKVSFANVKVYTGNKDDQFAAMEQRLSNKYTYELSCLPHGLEYGFMLPRSMPGKTVYCYTQNSARVLPKIYGNDGKYIYDEKLIKKVLGRDVGVNKSECYKVVQIFSSPRERELVRYVISELENSSINYTLKLHPLDSFSYYEDLCTSDVLTDSTFYGGLCISPPSTVLLQAIYSGGSAIGVYAHEQQLKDVEIQFPSLVDERINRFVKTSHKDFISYYDEQFT
ncbi:hypothetical protein KKI34_14390 [Pseudoalteromonas tetraodonis]|uniref:hypothetical protein n=1 Tax=Pseudoalteromonas tetraodonis TaxID=43659 RepID=UPI001BDE729C|nr:hypothetical protein [Pseudoalteromonas tetraodonis]MBT2152930.1 hypothetical protein [Pseudoalteromonas tetraodonis]